MESFVDEKYRENKIRYILQCLLAASSVLAVLLVLDAISHAAIIASLGASFFIAFTMPHSMLSRPRFLIGGYLVGITSGCLCYYFALFLITQLHLQGLSPAVLGALSVGLTMFLMVVTNTEHPPAAGIALGVVLNEFDYRTIIVVFTGIILISIIKAILKPILRDLL